MSIALPESQETLINDINDDSSPNVEIAETTEPEPKIMTTEEKEEINQMSYKELEAKLEQDKADRPPTMMPQSK